MKYLLLALLLMECSGSHLLRQYNYSTGIFYYLYLNRDEGTVNSPMTVPSPGSCFDLFGRGGGCRDTYYYHLDTKIVGTYMPEATVSISSADPSEDLRTRADIPYTVTLSLQKNLTYPYADAPEDDTNMTGLFVRYGENYPEGTYRIEQSNIRRPYEIESYTMSEGETSITVYNSILPSNYTKATGEETFAIYSEPIPADRCQRNEIIRSILDSKTIKIWPVAEATIGGVEEGERYIHALPDLQLEFIDLYPNSLTYAQIYEGDEYDLEADNSALELTVVTASVRDYDTIVPQNQSILLQDWDSIIEEDGIYTVEVVTVTPFNNGQPERLAAVTFEVDQEVSVRGSMTTSEK